MDENDFPLFFLKTKEWAQLGMSHNPDFFCNITLSTAMTKGDFFIIYIAMPVQDYNLWSFIFSFLFF